MENSRFDQIARTFATAVSRRRVIRAIIASAAASRLGGTTLNSTAAKDKGKGEGKGKDKDAKPDKGTGKDSAQEKVSICHKGETIEVAQPAVQAHLGHGDSLGPCPQPQQQQPSVTLIPSYRVSVDCSYIAKMNQTTCTCTATGADTTASTAIQYLLVPEAEVCSAVDGGKFTRVATPTAGQRTGYRSTGDQPVVTLTFSGEVTVGGTASYWCATDSGLVPAPGPGFVCVEAQSADVATATAESDISDSTGAIIVDAHSCRQLASTPTASSDWYDQCSTPESKLTFKITAGSGTPVDGGLTATTDVSGRAQFNRLPPGSYTLNAVDANWCHAESDHVDSDGNLLVSGGDYCHVWIFVCDSPGGS